MKVIKELISLLPPSKINQIKLIGSELDIDSKLGALYYGILNNDFSSDLEASQKLYEGKSNSAAYKKLKQRLRERLLNTLFFTDINVPKFADYGTAMANCYQEYALVKLLLSKHARKSAIWLAEHLIEQTKKYEFSELTSLISSDLMNHYGILQLDYKKFNYYSNIFNSSKNILEAEQKAAQAYSMVLFLSLGIKKKEDSLISDFKNLLNELDSIYPGVSTNRFILLYSNAKSSYLNDLGDYSSIIELCNEVLHVLGKKYFENPTLKFSLLRKKMNSYFNLGKIDKAVEISEEAKTFTKKGTHNWYIASYYQCLFLIHQKNYESANQILDYTLNIKQSKYLSPLLKEYWLTIEAYIELLKLIGKIESGQSTFRVQKFINDVPVYQMEKQGRKVAVILVQLMFFLGKYEYGKYIDRIEALQQYRRRHLGEANTFRANIIIKMMTKVGKLSFHPVRIKAHTKNDLKSLSSMSPEFSNSSADVEIIPYEDLWQMVLEILEYNLKKK